MLGGIHWSSYLCVFKTCLSDMSALPQGPQAKYSFRSKLRIVELQHQTGAPAPVPEMKPA